MTTTTTSDVYYDPYDVDINADPYPTFRRLRDEAPIYHNERYDVWALVPPRRRRQGAGQLADLLQLPRRHPRDHPVGHGAAARRGDVRGPAEAHDAPRPHVPGVHARADERARGRRCASSVAAASTRSSGSERFDFVAELGEACRCGSSACSSGSPKPTRSTVREKSDAILRTEAGQPMRSSRTPSPTATVRRVRRLARRPPVRRPDDRPAERRVRGRGRHDADPHPRRGPHLHAGAGRRRERDDGPAHRLAGEGAGDHPDQRRGSCGRTGR